jgi:hypothetical protein
MPATLDVTCTKCGKLMKVPTEFEGKKIRCKGCQQVLTVAAPAGKPKAAAAKAAAPAKKADDGAKPPPPPPPKPKRPFDDDEDENDNPVGVIKEEDVARCPHCAKELDPPDAVVCTNCGFNNKTRVKANTKKTIAPEANDWVNHLGPPVIASVIVIGLIVTDILVLLNMKDWVAGSFLELEDKDPVTGATRYIIKPGAFIAMIWAISLIIILPAARFAFRRFAYDFKPEERVKK